MSQNLYELVALGARYVFAGLMLLIVLRAWRITLIDSRRAAALRRLSPQTGLSGELLVRDGDGRPARALLLPDGGEFSLGRVRLLLVLSGAPEPASPVWREPPEEDPEAAFPVIDAIPQDPDDLFLDRPAPRREGRRK